MNFYDLYALPPEQRLAMARWLAQSTGLKMRTSKCCKGTRAGSLDRDRAALADLEAGVDENDVWRRHGFRHKRHMKVQAHAYKVNRDFLAACSMSELLEAITGAPETETRPGFKKARRLSPRTLQQAPASVTAALERVQSSYTAKERRRTLEWVKQPGSRERRNREAEAAGLPAPRD